MMVWKMIFLYTWVICRFHVSLPGCILLYLLLKWSGLHQAGGGGRGGGGRRRKSGGKLHRWGPHGFPQAAAGWKITIFNTKYIDSIRVQPFQPAILEYRSVNTNHRQSLILLMTTRNPAREPPGMVIKPDVNNGINYQPQLVQDFWTINSSYDLLQETLAYKFQRFFLHRKRCVVFAKLRLDTPIRTGRCSLLGAMYNFRCSRNFSTKRDEGKFCTLKLRLV